MATRTQRRKNPGALNRPERCPFPHLAPNYPIENWELPDGQVFQTVTLQQDDGSFISAVLNLPSLRFTAATRQAAEKGVIQRFLDFRSHPEIVDEDDDDLRVIREREKGPWMSLKEFLKRNGR
jgi:hypothetical protein